MSIERLLDLTTEPPSAEALYERIVFPDPPKDRPYIFINMASTVDGKIVIGEAGGPAAGVGGQTDQTLFRRLQRNAEAALIGSATLRASQVIYPAAMARFVVTRSGELPLGNRFFRDAPQRAYIILPAGLDDARREQLKSAGRLVEAGHGDVDWTAAMHYIRNQLGIRHLLCEGGGGVNDQLVRAGLADELFVTLAPKLKGGAHLPTMVGGDGFPARSALPLRLLSVYRDGSEIYLRYLLSPAPETYGGSAPAV